MLLDDHAAHPQAPQADRHPKADRSAADYQDLDFLPRAHRPTLLRKQADGDPQILRLIEKGNQPATIPLVPRKARTIDLPLGEPFEGPIPATS